MILCRKTMNNVASPHLAATLTIYALPGEELDERAHVIPLFAEQMVITVHGRHGLAGERAFPVRELNKGVPCTPIYRSERDDENAARHPGLVALPVIEPEFSRKVNLVTVRGRPYSPGVGALVREAIQKKWFGLAGRATLGPC